jgi:hypothetical protein
VEQENDTRLHQTTQNTAKQPNEAQADQLGKTQQVEKIDDQGYICQACTMSYKLGVLFFFLIRQARSTENSCI